MMCQEWNRYTVEMVNEPSYSFGSKDNSRTYSHEYLLESAYRPLSMHGLVCSRDGETYGSSILGASGGSTGVHNHSFVLLEDRCIAAVGDSIAALGLPDLSLLWAMKADDATCFGVYLATDEKQVIVHGELEISKVTVDGHKLWHFAGRDIFSGEFRIADGTVWAKDFNGDTYAIDVARGGGRIVERA